MKLLLTSSGITNDTLAHILEELAGKSFDDMKIVFIPTAALYDAGEKSWLINDMYRLIQRGAKVEIVDLAHLDKDELTERLKDSDVIFIGGGNPFYLSYWMEKSGMYDILSEILKSKVYAGISAGSMVMGSTLRVASHALKSDQLYDPEYEEFGPKGKSLSKTYRAVDFSIRPHLNSRYFPEITEEKIQNVATMMNSEIYVIDDESAIRVVDRAVDIVGAGEGYKIAPTK